jgi:hypothetical protein
MRGIWLTAAYSRLGLGLYDELSALSISSGWLVGLRESAPSRCVLYRVCLTAYALLLNMACRACIPTAPHEATYIHIHISNHKSYEQEQAY